MKKLIVLPTIALLTSISTAFAQTDDDRQRIATGPPTQLVSAPPAIEHHGPNPGPPVARSASRGAHALNPASRITPQESAAPNFTDAR